MDRPGGTRSQRCSLPRLESAGRSRMLPGGACCARGRERRQHPEHRQHPRVDQLQRRADAARMDGKGVAGYVPRHPGRRSRQRGPVGRRQRDRDAVPPYHPSPRLVSRQGDRGALGHCRFPPPVRARACRDVAAGNGRGRRDAGRPGDGRNSVHHPRSAPGRQAAARGPAGAVSHRARPIDRHHSIRRRDESRCGVRSLGAQRRPLAPPPARTRSAGHGPPARERSHRRRDIRPPSQIRRHGAGRRTRLAPGPPRCPGRELHQLPGAASPGARGGDRCSDIVELRPRGRTLAIRLRLPDDRGNFAGLARPASRRDRVADRRVARHLRCGSRGILRRPLGGPHHVWNHRRAE